MLRATLTQWRYNLFRNKVWACARIEKKQGCLDLTGDLHDTSNRASLAAE